MPLTRFFKTLFASPAKTTEGAAEALLGEVLRFLEGGEGRLGASRRLNGIVAGFSHLGNDEQARFVELVSSIDQEGPAGVARRYARMEESELFGTRQDRIAAFEAFVPPLRRLLLALRDAPGGTEMLAVLGNRGNPRLSREISALDE
jgi:hypothetical protein